MKKTFRENVFICEDFSLNRKVFIGNNRQIWLNKLLRVDWVDLTYLIFAVCIYIQGVVEINQDINVEY